MSQVSMQGKQWTKEQREVIIQSLQPYLEMGLSRNRACSLIGLAPATLSNWVSEDEALGIKLTGWENAMNVLATANIKQALEKEAEMEDTRKETSKWWAERRMKEDFSTKQETENKTESTLKVEFDSSFNATTPETKEHSEQSSQI